ncbi:hypothetical protein [Chryseobacterium sp. S90]|uniref:hypothetical protein n=1 Tax=Chryseobacterium sp. S90 TaxID=3395373 RepID=UPI0039BC229F
MLFGLAFSNNTANVTTANDNNPTTVTIQSQGESTGIGDTGETGGNDTGGDTIQVPPKK